MADNSNKSKGKRKKPSSDGKSKDTRFNFSPSDPRWQNVSRSKSKVQIDSRFAQMFTSSDFTTTFGLDPFGRKVVQSTKENLERFYHLDEKEESATTSDLKKEEQEEEADNEASLEQGTVEAIEQQTDETKDEKKVKSKKKQKQEEEEEENEEAEQKQEVEAYVEGDDVQETRRIAICRCDWENIRAVDLLVLLQSFVPSTGAINSVTVYPSKYGKQKEEKEYRHGPTGIWDEADEESEINPQKLREYELDKLNYFYAVVECDSVQTAADLYRSCDGMELERTGNIIDMSFVPDDTIFELPPRDAAREVPSSYKPPDSYNKVLQHTRVDLTWDADDPHRKQLVKRARVSADELRLADFKDYLASESEESDSDSDAEEEKPQEKPKIDPKKRQRFAALLREVEGNKDDEGSNMDMEITFVPGLSQKVESLIQAKDDPVALNKRKRKQEKLDMKKRKQQEEDDEHSEQEEQMLDDSEEEEMNKRKKRKKGAKKDKKKADGGKEAAELELLMMDETLGARSKDSKKEEESTKTKKKKKSKKGKETKVEADLSDKRFQELLYSSDFALDPTRLKKATPTMQKIQQERARLQDKPQPKNNDVKVEGSQSFKDPSIAALVSSVKRKAEQKPKHPQNNQASKQQSSKQGQATGKPKQRASPKQKQPAPKKSQ